MLIIIIIVILLIWHLDQNKQNKSLPNNNNNNNTCHVSYKCSLLPPSIPISYKQLVKFFPPGKYYGEGTHIPTDKFPKGYTEKIKTEIINDPLNRLITLNHLMTPQNNAFPSFVSSIKLFLNVSGTGSLIFKSSNGAYRYGEIKEMTNNKIVGISSGYSHASNKKIWTKTIFHKRGNGFNIIVLYTFDLNQPWKEKYNNFLKKIVVGESAESEK
ncbi:hypothetical protein CPAV1605_328 [seawater metagenome]|uniref:Uncharacterized protein n=1 Tax=seawater metagenome TaxID=1561972 RepID=A0A5E8CGR3_9ZZZZ